MPVISAKHRNEQPCTVPPVCCGHISERQECLRQQLEDLHECQPIDPDILQGYDGSRFGKPVHVMPQSAADKLYNDILEEKTRRGKLKYSNYLAQMGSTGSYHWPSDKLLPEIPSKIFGKVNFYGTQKKHSPQFMYDCNYNLAYPDNMYRYNYLLHREDRRHAKWTGLNINAEEMNRSNPGVLTNSEYGRRYRQTYLTERHHRVAWHKEFYRSRGADGAK